MINTDTTYWSSRDGKMMVVPPIDDLCLALKDKFLRLQEDNERLENEMKNMRDEKWKDDQLAKMKKELDNAKQDLYRGFGISKEEHDAIIAWQRKQGKKYTGAIGGRYEYRFFPTGIGVIGKIIDTTTNDEFTFQELE